MIGLLDVGIKPIRFAARQFSPANLIGFAAFGNKCGEEGGFLGAGCVATIKLWLRRTLVRSGCYWALGEESSKCSVLRLKVSNVIFLGNLHTGKPKNYPDGLTSGVQLII